MKKIKYLIILAPLLGVLLFSANFVSAMTAEELIAKIKALEEQLEQLRAQLAQIQGQTPVWCYDFNVNLKIGIKGDDVRALQTALEKEGFSIADEKADFDESTASAVSGFQEKYRDEILTPLGLKYATGYVGKATRAKLNKLYGCGMTIPVPKPVPPPFCSSTAVSCESSSKIVCPAGLDEKGCPYPCKCVPVACTQEAKICPDGSTVSRIPPSCEFALCPGEKTVGTGVHRIRAIDSSLCPPCAIGTVCPTCPSESAMTIYNAKVSVYNEKGIYIGTKDTSSGMAVFENLAFGNYTYTISAEGFQAEKSSFTVCATCGENTTIFLKKVSVVSPTITVISPNGGESWALGSTQTIRWTSSNVSRIVLDLVDQNGRLVLKNLVNITGNPGSANWLIPNYVSLGQYWLRVGTCPDSVVSCITTGPDDPVTIFDISDVSFNIVAATPLPTSAFITVISPNGGELWEIGKTYTIQWESKDLPSGNNLTIELLGSKGTASIFSSIANNANSLSWTIPKDFPVGTYILKVISYAFSCGGSSSSCGDETNRPFSIVATTVAKTCAELETSQKYYFNICSDSAYDNVCFNKYTGIYQGCTKNTNNDCTQSNANAEQNILCPVAPVSKSITVLYPNGGESWEIGKVYTIKWTTTGYSSDAVVRIIVTDESSGAENPIFNAYNSGGYSWMVPSTYKPHSNYKIKIIAPDEKYDKSDAPFSIVSSGFGLKDIENLLASISQVVSQLSEMIRELLY